MEYTKERPLRVVTLCSGYDSQCLALSKLKEHYQDFDYHFVFNYVVEEIQSFVNYVNTTTFNDLLEKMISRLRNDINNLNITEIH